MNSICEDFVEILIVLKGLFKLFIEGSYAIDVPSRVSEKRHF